MKYKYGKLPKYGNGGKKFLAGLAGFGTGLVSAIPGIGQPIAQAIGNTDIADEKAFQTASPIGSGLGQLGVQVGMGFATGGLGNAAMANTNQLIGGVAQNATGFKYGGKISKYKQGGGVGTNYFSDKEDLGKMSLEEYNNWLLHNKNENSKVLISKKDNTLIKHNLFISPSTIDNIYIPQMNKLNDNVEIPNISNDTYSSNIYVPSGGFNGVIRKKGTHEVVAYTRDGKYYDSDTDITKKPEYKFGGKVSKMSAMRNMYRKGGMINYSGAKHENGGIPINNNMKPVSRQFATAEVEDGEVAWNNYIFSNHLKPKRRF